MIHIYFLTANNELAKAYPHLTASKHPEVDFLLFEQGLAKVTDPNVIREYGLLPSGAINPALLAGLLLSPWKDEIRIDHIPDPTMDEAVLYIQEILVDTVAQKPGHVVLMESEPFGSVYAAILAKRNHDAVLPPNVSSLHVSDTALLMERGQLIAELAHDDLPHTSTYHTFTVDLLRKYNMVNVDTPLILSGGYMPLMALLESKIDFPFVKIATSIFLDNQTYYWEPVVYLNEDYMVPRAIKGMEAFHHAIGHKQWVQPYYQGHVKEGAGLGYAMTIVLSMLSDPRRPIYKHLTEDLRTTATMMDGMLADARQSEDT